MKNFIIAMAVFVGIGLLAWFFVPAQYLIITITVLGILIGVIGFIIGVKNTIEEADKKASE